MLIALGHRKQVGKDTIGRILKRENLFVPLAFADELYKIARTIFYDRGFQRKQVYDQFTDHKEWPIFKDITPRKILLELGRSIRSLDDSYFIRTTMDKIGAGNYVITDLRFKDEYTAVKQKGGILVRVDRDTGLPPDRADDDLSGYSFDYVLDNNGTMDDLDDRVRSLLLELHEKGL